ncbi:hypothetical protein [Haladaptatus halobius]|uniref:hypothetical protein n=1 Tax=Haladaptatus halobius TaxID=2884875 RepID=UPI001D0AA735|nr:hypothetical protein [Haladaptatus halobius]
MVYKIDYVDGDVLRWSVTETGVNCEVDESYTPTIYVSAHGDGEFSTARAALRDHPAVVWVAVVDERVSFRHDLEQVLQVDVLDLKAVNSVARMVRISIRCLTPKVVERTSSILRSISRIPRDHPLERSLFCNRIPFRSGAHQFRSWFSIFVFRSFFA